MLSIDIDLPEDWTQIEMADGPVTYSPDEGHSVLQISVMDMGPLLLDCDDIDVERTLHSIVARGKIGEVMVTGWSANAYGRVLRAEVDSDRFEEVIAWLLLPAFDDVLLVTWIGGSYGETAREIVAGLRPGRFSAAHADAMTAAQAALPQPVAPYALAIGDTEHWLDLSGTPREEWYSRCRDACAEHSAELLVLVFGLNLEGEESAVVHAESRTERRTVLLSDSDPMSVPRHFAVDDPDFDFFAPV